MFIVCICCKYISVLAPPQTMAYIHWGCRAAPGGACVLGDPEWWVHIFLGPFSSSCKCNIYIYTYNIHILNIAYNLVYSHISFVTIPMNISHSPCISQCYEPPGATWLVTFEHYPRWMTRPLHSHPPRPGSRISMWDILHTCVQIYFYVVGIYIYKHV